MNPVKSIVGSDRVFSLHQAYILLYFSLGNVFHGNYSSSKRAGFQISALLITLGISIVSGLITGMQKLVFFCLSRSKTM